MCRDREHKQTEKSNQKKGSRGPFSSIISRGESVDICFNNLRFLYFLLKLLVVFIIVSYRKGVVITKRSRFRNLTANFVELHN